MATIRLSDDVFEIAQRISDEKGLGSVRTAVEAVFRTCHTYWLSGAPQQTTPTTPMSTTQPVQPPQIVPTVPEGLDVAGELDSVM